MKIVYEYLIDTFDECERDLEKEGTSHFVSHVRDMVRTNPNLKPSFHMYCTKCLLRSHTGRNSTLIELIL